MNTIKCAVLTWLVVASTSVAAEITASVDRDSMTEYELLTLTVRIKDAATRQTPDFSAIEQHFEIVGQQSFRNRAVDLTNRRQVNETVLTLSLRPRREGNLRIPPISLGGERTRAIPIRVVPPSAANRQRNERYVFFDTSVDTSSAYVQSQIVYTVRLLYLQSIAGDFPPPPTIPETVVETIENEKRYEEMVDNRRYWVLEKRYAIFPQKSGPITIAPEIFRGTRTRGGLFGQRQTVTAVSKAISIDVKPTPAGFTGDTWIAAKSLTLLGRWTHSPIEFKVGEPINRVLSMQATGLAASLLPGFKELVLENVKTYADPPVTDERASPEGIKASSVTTIGMVPTRAGTVTLPEIRVPWWNTQADREEVAIIPAATYEVSPAVAAAVIPQSAPIPLVPVAGPAPEERPTSKLWMYVALLLALLLINSTWQWWRARHELHSLMTDDPVEEPPDTSERELLQDLLKACNGNQPADAHRSLFLWSNAKFATGSLQQLRARLQDPELDREIEGLERVLYSDQGGQSWRGAALARLVKAYAEAKHKKAKVRDLLAELNPG